MASTTHFHSPSDWNWPDDIGARSENIPDQPIPGAFCKDQQPLPPRPSPKASTSRAKPTANSQQQPPPQSARTWPPRTCRICLETVLPTYKSPAVSIPGLAPSPSVSYVSADPVDGRLIRPCKCKGSSRYVHEGCLQSWRHADPSYGRRNYWQCPTCGFRYKLERMAWGRAISSTATQLVLTTSILFFAMFALGFVADPIINLYLDPYSTLSSGSLSSVKIEPILSDDDEPTWLEHFIKGLASLGLLSFVKVLFALSPWQWWNLRSSGIMSGGSRTGANGRDRIANISWIVILIGVGTFLWVSAG